MRSTIAILLVASAACSLPPDAQPGETFGSPTGSDSSSALDESTSSGSLEPDDPSTSGAWTSSTSDGSDDGDDGLKLDVGSPDVGGAVPEIAEVFGHSGTVLYRLDPDTHEVAVVGPFAGCTATIIDIALDADSNMYGTAFSSLWAIDRDTAQCTKIANGSYPTSLSFVPAGTVDAEREALVGYDGAQYVRVDTVTGAVTNLGSLGGGLQSSGDLVSVIGGSSYLTVRGPGCDAADCIIEINPSNGIMLKNFGSVGYDEVFGLAFWAGRAYGFAREGVLFEIAFDGSTATSTPIPFPVAPPGLEFFGAGSTTSAPPAEG